MTTLSAMHLALQLLPTDHAKYLTSLISRGKAGVYKRDAESPQKLSFGPLDDDFPQLGKQGSLFSHGTLPSLPELKELCLRELPEAREYFGDRLMCCAPAGDEEEMYHTNDTDVSVQLIKSLTNPTFSVANTIVSFPSETLDQLCIKGSKEQSKDTLHTGVTSCTIISKGTIVPLQHSSEGMTVTTLLSGSMVWIIWPPTPHNLNILQTAYEDFAQDFDEAKLNVAHDLDNGVILVQAEGEELRIPPFCPMMGIALQTSALAKYTVTTVDQFIATFRKAPFLMAFFDTEMDGARKKLAFNQQLLWWLDRLLNDEEINGDGDDSDTEELDANYKLAFTEGGSLDTLLRSWNDVKEGLFALLGRQDAKVLCEIWTIFLDECAGRKCSICGGQVSHIWDAMSNHFMKMHWQRSEKVAGRVDSMGVGEDQVESVVDLTVGEESEKEADDDEMDVDS